ncbi:MAG: RNA polymerase sigma factor [Candidatus Latescibacteria bacterium]|nr:RNA polymerase sigma factor [Candidatus Latescibacterota bacterium]
MRRFKKLCSQHQHRVYTFAYYYLGNREDAEDVTQEVLIRLWERGQQVEGEGLPAWITRVTRNACLDALRKRQSARILGGAANNEEVLARVPGTDPDPEQLAEVAELRQRLNQALALLPELQRSILILREVQGRDYEEISATLDLPLNTMKVYLHRGRQRLREILKMSQEHDPN